MQSQKALALVINAPEFFADGDFINWLNRQESPKFSWHGEGEPTEGSDVVVLVDPSLNGEGSDSDMPEPIWAQIVEACRQHFRPHDSKDHILVWLKNF